MKRITASLILIALLGNASCKKEEKKTTPDPDPPPVARTWTVDGTTYTVAFADVRSTNVTFGSSNGANSIGFNFQSLPKASGVYNIGHTIPTVASEVQVSVTNNSPYMTGDPESGTVNVTVADGRVHIKCSGIQFFKLNSAADTIGSATLSADVYY